VDGGMNFGHGVLDISRDHIVLFVVSFVEGVFHPSFAMKYFSKPFYFPLIYYGPCIEFYVKWKLKSTAIPLEVRNTLSSIRNGN
jgi:hypothetical protein